MRDTFSVLFVGLFTAVVNLIYPEPHFEPDGYDK
jgi:hypothetical protein